jgi:hypothetical protein
MQSTRSGEGAPGLRVAMIALALAATALLAVERVWLAAVQPLWFDEAWALMAARTPTWGALVHEALTDVNAPLYYALLRAWTRVAGFSDLALRAPGLLSLTVAGLAPLIARTRRLPFEGRLAWSTLLYAWWGVNIFQAGRCYGLLVALSTLQCLVFADLVRAPNAKRALAWCALSSVAILTHYYALFVTAAQGLIYLVALPRTRRPHVAGGARLRAGIRLVGLACAPAGRVRTAAIRVACTSERRGLLGRRRIRPGSVGPERRPWTCARARSRARLARAPTSSHD